MIEAISLAHAFAPAATPVILYGETGTGKTFLADYIHALSGRADGFHPESVGSWSPQLAADKLFGHVPGAFTDAKRIRAGCIAAAGAGTLLLDEMHALDLSIQQQLLQVLDRGTYIPVGADRAQTAVCRFILAMKEHPDVLMARGVLLEDLRYRFGMCSIWIPPLRERLAEIPLFARQALQRCTARTQVDGPERFSDAAMALLCEGEWKGNVRELDGHVERAYLVARKAGRSEIDVEHFPEDASPQPRYRPHGDPRANWIAAQRALMKTGGNITEAAKLLGTSRTALHKLLASQRLGLAKQEHETGATG